MAKNTISRRGFLRLLGYGGIAISSQKFLSACRTLVNQQVDYQITGEPDIEVQLTAKPGTQQIFQGNPTSVWHYTGEVLNGPAESLISLPDSYLGPIFNIKKGEHLRVHFENQLPEKSIVHWHGLHVPESADGHPRLAVENGKTYIYDFQIMDRAGTYWYHPHPHGRTGPQVYQGLAGLFLIHDDEEASLNLPSQDQDIPIVIQDRYFDQENQLVYDPTMMGMFGNQILVNGLPNYEIAVDRTAYRLRLMNGSNARIYKLAWSDGTPTQIIGTEGGLLEAPLERDYITLAPAQRIDLWVDFGKWDPGNTIKMVSLSESEQNAEEEFIIFSARINDTAYTTQALPATFPKHKEILPSQAVNANDPRTFELQMGRGMRWTINGKIFDMTEVSSEETVRLGDVEIWEFINQGMSGMGGMIQPHPMHIHGLQFKILERDISSTYEDTYNGLKDGFVDEGWHDTVLVMPGERVKVLMKFEDFTGLYLYHCHNLEHEDMGMMRNYHVKNS